MHTCHVHNIYPPSHQIMPQQYPNCLPPPHQGYPGYPNTPSALPPVSNQHFPHPHPHPHPHQHLPPQRPDALEMEFLSTQNAIRAASSLHVPPLQVSSPASLFMPTDSRGSQLELLQMRARQHRNSRLPPHPRTRWHPNEPFMPTTAQYSGFLLHFL